MEKHIDFAIKGLGQNFKMFVQHIKCIDFAIEVVNPLILGSKKIKVIWKHSILSGNSGPEVLMAPKILKGEVKFLNILVNISKRLVYITNALILR